MSNYDLVDWIEQQKQFGVETFGPGERTQGIIDHIKKELKEIESDPTDLYEWIDVVILALDGAWRVGYQPDEIARALFAKLERNKNRKWPDWRTVPLGQAIEHIRE